MTPEKALDVIAAIEVAGQALAEATRKQLTIARFLSVRKDEAIRRQMAAKNLSATAAEKIVEADEEFATQCLAAITAEADRLLAVARYDVAKLTARLAVALASTTFEDL